MWTRWSAILIVALTAHAEPSHGQVIKTIKEHATKKVDDKKRNADSAIVHATDKALDSTLTKTARPLDTLVSRSAALVDTTLNRTETAVSAALKQLTGDARETDHIVADLANGRVSLPELRFTDGTDRLDSASMPVLQRLATALKNSAGSYLIEGHVVANGDPAAEMSLSRQRALAVKTALTALGVSAEHLFAMGFGAVPAPNGTAQSVARIEVARMQ